MTVLIPKIEKIIIVGVINTTNQKNPEFEIIEVYTAKRIEYAAGRYKKLEKKYVNNPNLRAFYKESFLW